MPIDSETGESYDSAEDALKAAGVENAASVLSKLEDSGYKLEASASAEELSEESSGEEAEEETAPAAEEETSESVDEELEPGGSPDISEEEKVDIAMGMVGEDEPMSKRRDAVAEGLMDKYKTNMV